ncbi:TPA: HAMP domain-containing protein [Pseudomonas putida]|uniref:ATP-binding protein n=1 Tax=Pseudomonas putida TaxID=303 RepID=UPI00110CC360|nr:ATP-binding protein [Pseudomonas putida]MDD1992715.1 ATP-binding protein [Pseudomonas putida]HDS0918442.1 HAMP domain-containing protein [Pseudomonas putida]HDS0931723.1 HAMP domain-containing protein [Pseudomonas putida]HDS1782351.1 HAMP domain-containing protein [Pseudomonas putida]HDS3797000.1 HAMP domain-containing protein [Pseudomonas putida]
MKKPWETNLTARFIFLMLLALIISQLLTLGISWDERGKALREVAKGEFLSRASSLAMLLDSMPGDKRREILNVSNTTYGRFWLHKNEARTPSQWWLYARAHLLAPLANNERLEDTRLNAKVSSENLAPEQIDKLANWTTPTDELWSSPRPVKFVYLAPLNVMGIATPLKDGTWLHAVYAKPVEVSPFETKAVLSWLMTALALSAIAALIAREISRPLKQLAEAAERLGRGEIIDDLPETGPADIRRTAKAFNRMQLRIRRFVEDRTRMLAAIGHDLRTPLTSLRLRAEFVVDPDLQDKMLRTIAEISAMTEAAIHYARGECLSESTRLIDISALVESLCEDLTELGLNVQYATDEKIVLHCRPDSLRRALRNLIENAVRYGTRAQITVAQTPNDVLIEVQDEGPGIPPGEMEQVFTPFYRLEQSRNRHTGGVGLGLPTARSVARQHGGDITLHNSPNGMTARIILPKP